MHPSATYNCLFKIKNGILTIARSIKAVVLLRMQRSTENKVPTEFVKKVRNFDGHQLRRKWLNYKPK